MKSGKLLKDEYPELFKEIDVEKTLQEFPGLEINNLAPGSDKYVYWKCTKYPNHSWKTQVKKRALSGHDCPICAGQQILSGFNDLETWCKNHSNYTYLLDEWDKELNKEKMNEIAAKSHKKYYWSCKNGHSFLASPADRTRPPKGRNCPFCSNKKVLPGYNDLQTLFPNIAKEFASDLNGITPDKVIAGSNKSYYWRCSKNSNHVWKQIPNTRTRKNLPSGCPFCSHYHSAPEITVYKLAKRYVDNSTILGYSVAGYNYDIYIPSLNLLIEYDGYPYHSNCKYADKKEITRRKNIEKKKNNIAIKNKYYIIRICEVKDEQKIQAFKESRNGVKYYYINYSQKGKYFAIYSNIFKDIFKKEISISEIKKTFTQIKENNYEIGIK